MALDRVMPVDGTMACRNRFGACCPRFVVALAQQSRARSGARRCRDRARELPFLFPDRDMPDHQHRPIILSLAAEPLKLHDGGNEIPAAAGRMRGSAVGAR